MSWIQEKEKSNNLLRNVFLFGLIVALVILVVWGCVVMIGLSNNDENTTTTLDQLVLNSSSESTTTSSPVTTTTTNTTTTSTTSTSTTTTLDLSMCLADKINDGLCDFDNLLGSCFFDSFDCCNETVSWIGDGICQEELDNLQCNFDGGDCRAMNATRHLSKYPDCKYGAYMSISAIGDGYCDDIFNSPACGFDEGDCCLQSQELSLEFCTTCACLQTKSRNQTPLFQY